VPRYDLSFFITRNIAPHRCIPERKSQYVIKRVTGYEFVSDNARVAQQYFQTTSPARRDITCANAQI